MSGSKSFTPEKTMDDVRIPTAPPLFAAQPYNHDSFGRSRTQDEVYADSGNPYHRAENLHSIHGSTVSNPQSPGATAEQRKASNSLSPTSFGKRKSRTAKNTLLKKISPAIEILRARGTVKEKLFGNVVDTPNSYATSGQYGPDVIAARTLVPSSIHLSNSTSNLWILTVDTNNGGWKTEKSTLHAFSFSTVEEAREASLSFSPPLLTPFDKAPTCYVCDGKFAIFRRAVHCKNCGSCVCRKCVVSWPVSRLPQTYNHKREPKLHVCRSCNQLNDSFYNALIHGHEDEALALYETGNVNLRSPFGKDGNSEIMFPIHCAIIGGSLNLVRWLVDIHFCPIFVTSLMNVNDIINNNHTNGTGKQPLLTSEGRSALNLAMSTQQVYILRYLVLEKGMSLYETKSLRIALLNLEKALEELPTGYTQEETRLLSSCPILDDNAVNSRHQVNNENFTNENFRDSFEIETAEVDGENKDDDGTVTSMKDACIICFANVIDCVVLPCGHQICCTQCSKSMKLCPICNIDCSFVRIFKP